MKIGESDVWELTFMQGYDSLKLKGGNTKS